MLSDIEIAQKSKLKPISDIAAAIGIDKKYLEHYGHYKAKVDLDFYKTVDKNRTGKLILVTATTPTPAGEGKTTTTIGLGLSLNCLGKKAIVCLREPSLGPVFGIKGGATGGGYAQVLPMEEINLHFTGDIHAVGSANNLLAAMIDNHIKQGNELKIDIKRITWRRCMDMNDRSLRQIKIGLGGPANGTYRKDGFDITVASEVMAILCLSEDLDDLKQRLGKIIIGFNIEGKPVTAKDLKANGAMAVLLKEAIKPNLVQTTEGTPAFIHGGPFANIAHGTNSIIATKMALKLADYVITEAGFAADLGAEKFFDIVSRVAHYDISGVVIVTTVRSLKMHGAGNLIEGLPNLQKHIYNVKKFGLPVVVGINKFTTDTDEEILLIQKSCEVCGVEGILNEIWGKGGKGGVGLAKALIKLSEQKNDFKSLYNLDQSLKEKINIIATSIYGAKEVKYSPQAKKDLRILKSLGYDNLPVCIAKTQSSLSDNPKLLGVPQGFTATIRKLKVSAGAGFVVAFAGEIMTMPGLPKEPAAVRIDLDKNGCIQGLF